MPDYSTNVIFKLSVAGDEALNELRSYLSGMKQLLGELNTSSGEARTNINAAANASAAMGTSLAEIARQGAGAAQAINSVANATQKLSAATRETPSLGAIVTKGGVVQGSGDLYGMLAQQERLASGERSWALERLNTSNMFADIADTNEAAWAKETQTMAERTRQQRELMGLTGRASYGYMSRESTDIRTATGAVTGGRDLYGLIQQPAWTGASNVINTFAGGAEAASLEMWGVRRIAFDLQQIGQQGMNTTMQMIESLSNAVEVYGEFNDATTRAAATMELPVELFEELEEGVRAASIETAKFSPEQVAEGLRMWAAGTGDVITNTDQLNDILEDTTTIQKLAAMNAVGLEQTMSNVGGVMAAYNLRTEEVARVTSVFNYVAAKSFANVDDLGQAFTFIGPIASQMGISFEESAAALALLSDNNIKGSKAGRALRQTLIALADPTKSVDDAMTALLGSQVGIGETWKDLIFQGGQFIGLAEYIDLLAESVEGLTAAEQSQRLAELATANELPSLTSLVMDQVEARKNGINIISVYTKILENNVDAEVMAYKRLYEEQTGYVFSTEGALARMENQWDRYINSSSGQLDKMKQEWNAAVLAMAKPMAEVLLPTLVKVAGAVADVAEFLNGSWVASVAVGATAIYGISSALVLMAGRLIQVGALTYTLQEGMKAVRAAGGLSAGLAGLAGGVGQGAAIAKSALVLKAAITSGALAGGVLLTAAIVAGAVAVSTLVKQQKQEVEIEGFLSRNTLASATFKEMFAEEEISSGAAEVPVWTTRWTAKTAEARKILHEITGETRDWTTSQETVLEVMRRITTEMNEQAKLSLNNSQFAAQQAENAAIRFYMAGGQYHSPELAKKVSEQNNEMVDAWAQYASDRKNIIDGYQQQEENLVSNHNEWMVDAEKGLVRQLSDLANSYSKSKAREARDFDLSRAREIEDFELSQLETIEDAQREREKTTKDHYEELEKLARDHQNNLVDLLEERDVRGITKEMRSYQENVADSEREYGQTMAETQLETERSLADAVAEFNKRLLREDADRLKDLADQEADYQESVSSAITDYNESVAEQEAELAKNKDALKEDMAGDLASLDAELGDSIAALDGTMEQLNAEMYPRWLSEVQDFWDDYRKEWLQGFIDIAGMAGLNAALRLDMDLPITATYGGAPMSEEDYHRASGGYAGHGRYILGEGGREFVLNAATTGLMEDRFGSLSQNTFRNIGQTFNFSPVISVVGRQDSAAVEGVLDRWWKTKQQQIKDMVRA